MKNKIRNIRNHEFALQKNQDQKQKTLQKEENHFLNSKPYINIRLAKILRMTKPNRRLNVLNYKSLRVKPEKKKIRRKNLTISDQLLQRTLHRFYKKNYQDPEIF